MRSAAEGAPSGGAGRPEPVGGAGHAPPSQVDRVLTRGVEAGVITARQADALRVLAAAPAPPRGGVEAAAPSSRVPVLAEATGYVGAVLALAAGGVALGRSWDQLSNAGRLSLFGATALVLWGAGFWVRGSRDAAVRRLVSVVWLLALAAAAGFWAVLFVLGIRLDPVVGWMDAALVATALAGAMWAARREALQLLGLTVGVVASAVLALGAAGVLTPTWGGLLVWGAGLVLGLLAWREVTRPAAAAHLYAYALALVGPAAIAGQHGWGLLVGLATAAALMGAAVGLRRTLLLAIGAIGLFAYVVASVLRFFGETIGVSMALFVAGILLLVLAFLVVRLRGLTARPTPRGPRPAGPAGGARAPAP